MMRRKHYIDWYRIAVWVSAFAITGAVWWVVLWVVTR